MSNTEIYTECVIGSTARGEQSPHYLYQKDRELILISGTTGNLNDARIFIPSLDKGENVAEITHPEIILDAYDPNPHSPLYDLKLSMLNEPSLLHRIKNGLRDIFRNNYKICEQGGTQIFKGQEVRHFDLESHEFYYNPAEGMYSLKYGPLRCLQIGILRRLVEDAPNYFRETRRPSFRNKIEFMRAQGIISNDEYAQSAIDTYEHLLGIYSLSKQEYYDKSKCTCIRITDPDMILSTIKAFRFVKDINTNQKRI